MPDSADAQIRYRECRSCHKPVLFVKHYRTGNTMCLEENMNGNLSLAASETGLVAVPARDDLTKYLAHHANCPDAERWRKKRPVSRHPSRGSKRMNGDG